MPISIPDLQLLLAPGYTWLNYAKVRKLPSEVLFELIFQRGEGLRHVMVNFMCQLHWTMGHSDFWLHIISGCVCDVVSDEINI